MSDIQSAALQRASRYRWIIVVLLFAAIAINYIDRQMIGILKPTIQADLGWSETDYAHIVFWFQCAYAIGFLTFGRFIDRVGVHIGYAVAFAIWTVANIAHGMVHTVTQFALARFVLGFGESGSFPASLKAISEWFPQKERAQATGLFNAGTAVGPIVTPLIVPLLVVWFGDWRPVFIFVGAVTAIWLVAWLLLYRRPEMHPKVNAAELAHIQSSDRIDAVEAELESKVKVSWVKMLKTRELWAYALGKFLTDPVWWLYLFWLPSFLHDEYGLSLTTFFPALLTVYLMADFGSIGGGWLSSRLIKNGKNPNFARKATMLFCAVVVTPVVVVLSLNHLWATVIVIGFALAAHQAWSANLMTLPSDMFPKKAVASVIGFGGMCGAVGGMLMSTYIGYILDAFGSYQPIFIVAGCTYLVAFAVISLLTPRLKQVALEAVTQKASEPNS